MNKAWFSLVINEKEIAMLVRAKIIDVEERVYKEKLVADVTLKFSDPAEAVVCTLWNNSVAKGEHKAFAAAAGEECFLAIRPDVWNNQVKYNLVSNIAPQLIKAPAAKAVNS